MLWTLLRFADRGRLDAYVAALNAVIARHDILRTAVLWEGLREPVQVVWREASIEVEEVELEASAGDVLGQLEQSFAAGRHRVDAQRAPMMRVLIAYNPVGNEWVGMQLSHHLALDHITLEMLNVEVREHLSGRGQELAEVLPYRCFVADMQQRRARGEYEGFFRSMLSEVEESTAPFGLLDVHGDGSGIAQASRPLDAGLSAVAPGGASARGECGEHFPCGLGSGAVARLGPGGSGVRHGGIWADVR